MHSAADKIPSQQGGDNLTIASAGIDITSGIAADHFIRATGKELWGRDCLIRIVDAICNYSDVIYPLPTKHAIQHNTPADLPTIMRELEVKHSLLHAQMGSVAEDHIPTRADLGNDYSDFQGFCTAKSEYVNSWIDLHKVIGPTHGTRLPDKVQPWVKEFFTSDARPRPFATAMGVSIDGLMFAFDVYARAAVL
jgi:hypothetical protein